MSELQNQSLNIVAALNCEVSALIDHYNLRKVEDRPFKLFQSVQGNQINLVISGIGLINAAAAVAWLGARTADASTTWLNIGTAGHQFLDVGQLNLVHCVQQEGGARKHYPPLVAQWSGNTIALLSCQQPLLDYPVDQAVDMESSAFFHVAGKFSDSEMIQSIKVISDNQDHGIEHINAEFIKSLMKPHTQSITDYVGHLLDLSLIESDQSSAMGLIDHLHSTVSQTIQYKELVSKYHALHLFDHSLQDAIKQSDSMSNLLHRLSEGLLAEAPQAVRL